MAETTRVASTPTQGALRDATRTFVAFVIAFLLTRLVGAETAVDLAGATEGLVVIITSALFAFVGKLMRDKDDLVVNPVGKVVGKVV
jgi:uncharacterized membrane protein YccC